MTWCVQAEGEHHKGIHFEIFDVLHHLRMDIVEAKMDTDGETDICRTVVAVPRDKGKIKKKTKKQKNKKSKYIVYVCV